MQFLKNILSTLVALILFSGVVLVIGMVVLVGLSQEEPVTVPDGAVLSISLNKPITELEFENPLAQFGLGGKPNSIGLVQLITALEKAKEDDRIKGIYLQSPYLMAGFASSEEIRNALIDFKESGKFIVSYADNYTEGGYYLSSISDEVYMHPEGYLELNGISSSVVFFTGLFEKLEIEPQIFRVGEYKSAIEPFERKNMSEENKEQVLDLIHQLNDHLVANVAAARDMEESDVAEISNQMKVRFPEDAVEFGLIDGLKYRDEMKDVLADLLDREDGELEMITYDDYSSTYSNYKKTQDRIAVIVGSGDIVSGGSSEYIDGHRFAAFVREAREDESVKAIVLRVNSLGGQLQASDLIWREIKLASEEKPVIASFSDYATSGGYYIAMEADTIVASPNTITGSIGIFGMLFNLGPMMENKLGITWDEVSTGEFSGMYTVNRSLSEVETDIIQKEIERGYDDFTRKAAEGRDMAVEDLRKIASGRVWSGTQAIDNGLVDVIGGLSDAIDIAANSAELEDYRITYLPKQKTIFEELASAGEDTSEGVLQKELGENYALYSKLKNLVKYQGLQARSPWEIKFK